MYYILSDIHGHYDEFLIRLNQIKQLCEKEKNNKLILLGDYIDRGPDSYKVVKEVYELQQKYGVDKVVALRGNHEEWFLEYLFESEDVWLVEDTNLVTSKTFLSDKELLQVRKIALQSKIDSVYSYIRECIKANHTELLKWMKQLPYYHKTDTQIFVHAGVDEEAEDWWEVGTPEYVFVGKYPPTKGRFYMDIIAGHTSTATISQNQDYHDVFYDKESHYYIDGSVSHSKYIPVLVWDESKKEYFSLSKEGNLISIT